MRGGARSWALIAALVGITSWNGIAAAAAPNVTDVFVAKEEGYACYRIPALLQLANGTLLAFAEGRRFSCADHGWNDIVAKSSLDGGATWSALRVVYGESATPCCEVTIGNPAPVLLANGSILLPFCRNNTEVGTLVSHDGGLSFHSPRYIPLPGLPWVWLATGPPGSVVAQAPSGAPRIVVPVNYQTTSKVSNVGGSLTSDDGGDTWHLSNAVAGVDECQAAVLSWVTSSTVLLSARPTSGLQRIAALSVDGGASWGAPWTTITETECEASTIAMPKHTRGPRLVLSSAFDAVLRANLTLHTSVDNGHTWTPQVTVYPGFAAYSSLVALPHPDTVGLLFERDLYAAIAFTQVTVP